MTLRPRLPLAAFAAASLLALSGCSQPTPEERLDEAYALFEQGNVARGVLRFQDLVREAPDDPAAMEARLFLARYYASDGNAPRALENLRAVYDRTRVGDPRQREAMMGLISINIQIGEYDAATGLYRTHLEALPEGAPERDVVKIEFAEHLMAVADVGEETDEELLEEGRGILRDLMLNHGDPPIRGRAREVYANYYRMRGLFDESNAVYEEYLAEFPDDNIRTDIELAMAINVWQSGEREEGVAMFEAVADQYLADLEDELETNIRNNRLMDLASMFARIEEYESARSILEMVMEENVHSEVAIRAQFSIASLYVDPAFRKQDEELLQKSITVFEQIARENPGTNIEDSARRAIEELPVAFQRMLEAEAAFREQQAAAEAEAAEQQADADEDDAPGSEDE